MISDMASDKTEQAPTTTSWRHNVLGGHNHVYSDVQVWLQPWAVHAEGISVRAAGIVFPGQKWRGDTRTGVELFAPPWSGMYAVGPWSQSNTAVQYR